jgi:hypothetical protein
LLRIARRSTCRTEEAGGETCASWYGLGGKAWCVQSTRTKIALRTAVALEMLFIVFPTFLCRTSDFFYFYRACGCVSVLPVLDSLDNYKMLSERMNMLTFYLPRRNWSSVLTSSERESAVYCCIYIIYYNKL